MKPMYPDWMTAEEVDGLSEDMLPQIRADFMRKIVNASRRAQRGLSNEKVSAAISEIECYSHNAKLIHAAIAKAAEKRSANN